MKVVGGFAAVLSLVIVASQVKELVNDSRQHKQVALELTAAAELVLQADDSSSAMALLKRAEASYPGLPAARDLQVKIGMEYLRRLYPLDGPGYGMSEAKLEADAQGQVGYQFYTTIDQHELEQLFQDWDLYQLLAIRAANSKGTIRAQCLAHLGWLLLAANPGELKSDVDRLFAEARVADQKDVFANAMRAAWLVSRRYAGDLTEEQRITEARKQFDVSRANATQTPSPPTKTRHEVLLREWVLALQLEALPALDALNALIDARARGESVTAVGTLGLTRAIFIGLSGRGGAPRAEEVSEVEHHLMGRFDNEKLVDIAVWLAKMHYGCDASVECIKNENETAQMLYAIGRIHELNDDRKDAQKYYESAKGVGDGGWWDESIKAGLARLALKP
jgi:hypothetical protein